MDLAYQIYHLIFAADPLFLVVQEDAVLKIFIV